MSANSFSCNIEQEKRKNSCGIGPIAFISTVQSLESIPQSLSSSGLFLSLLYWFKDHNLLLYWNCNEPRLCDLFIVSFSNSSAFLNLVIIRKV